jgi:hypothetical protein
VSLAGSQSLRDAVTFDAEVAQVGIEEEEHVSEEFFNALSGSTRTKPLLLTWFTVALLAADVMGLNAMQIAGRKYNPVISLSNFVLPISSKVDIIVLPPACLKGCFHHLDFSCSS